MVAPSVSQPANDTTTVEWVGIYSNFVLLEQISQSRVDITETVKEIESSS